MSKSLIIVESPAKARTLQKYLGADFDIRASMGHIKDLPERRFGVEIGDEGDEFVPSYEVVKGRTKIINEIQKAAKKADYIYLGPDPDREGEAIAFHIAEVVSEVKKKKTEIYRVLFNEITKQAIIKAIENPTKLEKCKYESQQTRRILDRLVGYKISPLLWKKVKRGLSAGRVQSVAVKLICERDKLHTSFKKEEYWSILCELKNKQEQITDAVFFKKDGKTITIKNEQEAKKLADLITKSDFIVQSVQKKKRKRFPVPPFITSTLQQEAYRKLGFSAKKTMRIAQQLYEGIALGEEGPVGLISYMRTDSFRLSNDAMQGARDFILAKYGKDYVPDKPILYKTKKTVQDAHEAIRPTSIKYAPETVNKFLDKDNIRLYSLIWKRFLACQMNPAVYDQTVVEFGDSNNHKIKLKSTGSIQRFKGFLSVYEEGIDDGDKEPSAKASKEADIKEGQAGFNRNLPDMKVDDVFSSNKVVPKQHFTQPPPRYNDSSIIKDMEQKGIGRPSTYATIISNIQDKNYVIKEKGCFIPTELGQLITGLLVDNFPTVLDVGFTAEMESMLDAVEEGEKDWQNVLKQFYSGFVKELEHAEEHMRNVKKEEVPTDIICEICNEIMVLKWGKNGRFLACSAFPNCKNTKEYSRDEEGKVVVTEAEKFGKKCNRCGKDMVIKTGRFGRFVACMGYPDCNNTQQLTIGINCPESDCKGEIVEKKSKGGKVFWSCSEFPKCKFASWHQPIKELCPVCEANLVEKISKKTGVEFICIKSCGYSKVQSETQE